MKQKSALVFFFHTVLVIVFAMGFSGLACRNQQASQQVEIPEDWISYESKEIGIAFYYPSEWGNVTDYLDYYIDYFTGYYMEDMEEYPEEVKKDAERVMDWLEEADGYGDYLMFSNLDNEWSPHIRITSVQEIVSRMEELALSNESRGEDYILGMSAALFYPLMGQIAVYGMVNISGEEYSFNTKLDEQLPEMLGALAELPEEASAETLRETARPVLILFANGLRYPDEFHEESGEPGWVNKMTQRGQIAVADGSLEGVTEMSMEGWENWVRRYWECILTAPNPQEDDTIIYFSFTLELPSEGWEELLAQQVEQFEQVVQSVRLLER